MARVSHLQKLCKLAGNYHRVAPGLPRKRNGRTCLGVGLMKRVLGRGGCLAIDVGETFFQVWSNTHDNPFPRRTTQHANRTTHYRTVRWLSSLVNTRAVPKSAPQILASNPRL